MSDESTEFILGDAVADATSEGRRGLFGRKKKKRQVERALTHCENCGAPLTGEYCAQCGQHAVDYKRSLWRVLIDAADSFLNWDTKFFKSIGVLLTRPWKLTNDFNAGRRARYVHPLRLYLLASIAFFLIFKLVKVGDHAIELGPQDRAEIATALGKLVGADSVLTADQQAKVESIRTRLTQGDGAVTEQERDELQDVVKMAMTTKMKDKFERGERARLKAALRQLPEMPKAPDAEEIRNKVNADVARTLSEAGISTPTPSASAGAASPPSIPTPPPITAPADVPGVAASPSVSATRAKQKPGIHFGKETGPKDPFEIWMENRIKGKVGEDGTKAKLFLQTLLNNIPTMMLCCVPLFALVLKILYVRRRRYYVEHLVYALHIHTFAYVAVTIIVLCAMAIALWSDTARALFSTACGFLVFGLVFVSIRRVYNEGWFFTTFKFLLGGIAYLCVLITAVGVTAFITLLLPD